MYSLFAHGIGKRRYEVALCRAVLLCAELSGFCVPQSEPVMMLRGYHGVLCAAFLYQFSPRLRVVIFSRETLRLRHIFIIRDSVIMERPAFGNTFHGINAPMDEYSEFSLAEPFHTSVVILL